MLSCVQLCDLMDCSLPGSSVHGILQARILEWVAISFSRRSSQPRIEPGSPALQADALPSEPPGKSWYTYIYFLIYMSIICSLIYFWGAGSSLQHAISLSSCGEQGLFSSGSAWVSHCGGFSRCTAWAVGCPGSAAASPGPRAQTQESWRTGLVAPRHVGSSGIRNRICVPCMGRWILYH